MRYAFMSFSCPELSLAESVALAASLGYDGFEPRIGGVHRHGVELAADAAERRLMRDTLENAGVALACLATPFRFANPATVENEISGTEAAIDLAADLGSTRLRVFGGAPGDGLDRAAAIRLLSDSLRRLASRARSRGVRVCLETHDAWTHPDHVAEVMAAVDDEAIGVTWDVMHPLRTSRWTIRDAWQRLRPWIAHVHAHDGLLDPATMVFSPVGAGEYDMPAFFACLAEMNYSGFVTGEWINCAGKIDLATELASFRRLAQAARSLV